MSKSSRLAPTVALLLVFALGVRWLARGREPARVPTGGPGAAPVESARGSAELALPDAAARAGTAAPSAAAPAEPVVSAGPDAPAAGAAPPLGRIFGRVLWPDGQPAVGRSVRILKTVVGGVQRVTTDADGRYDQGGLVPWRYHVSTQPTAEEVAAAGFTTGFQGLDFLAQESVVLGPGEERQVDLGAPPARPIRVHGRLVGRGPAATGILVWCPEGEYGYDDARYVVTDAAGAYDGVLARPGPYHVSVIVRPGAVRVDLDLVVPDVQDLEVDVELPAGELVVVLRDAGGAPVEGASVDVTPRAGVWPIPPMSGTGYTVRSDAAGRARIDRLRPGRWAVAAHDVAGADGSPLAFRPAVVELAPDGAPVELELERVPARRAEGVVVDGTGAPVAGAYVHAFDADGEPLNPLRGARTRKQGEFALAALPEGAAVLLAVVADRASLPVDLPPATADGAAPAPLQLTLQPAAVIVVDRSALQEPAWIEVRDARGNLVSALLDLARVSTASARAASTHTSRYDVPAGTYTIRAVGARGVVAAAEVALLGGEARTVRLAPR